MYSTVNLRLFPIHAVRRRRGFGFDPRFRAERSSSIVANNNTDVTGMSLFDLATRPGGRDVGRVLSTPSSAEIPMNQRVSNTYRPELDFSHPLTRGSPGLKNTPPCHLNDEGVRSDLENRLEIVPRKSRGTRDVSIPRPYLTYVSYWCLKQDTPTLRTSPTDGAASYGR